MWGYIQVKHYSIIAENRNQLNYMYIIAENRNQLNRLFNLSCRFRQNTALEIQRPHLIFLEATAVLPATF